MLCCRDKKYLFHCELIRVTGSQFFHIHLSVRIRNNDSILRILWLMLTKVHITYNASGFSGCYLIAEDWVQHRENPCSIYDRKVGIGEKEAVASGCFGFLLKIIITFVLFPHTYNCGGGGSKVNRSTKRISPTTPRE